MMNGWATIPTRAWIDIIMIKKTVTLLGATSESIVGSRAALEPRFRSVLGRTLHQEVQRVRIERAKSLLAETDLPIKQIALQSGFKNVQYLTRVFSLAVGQATAAFRKNRRHARIVL
jgi:transcriptional regulator GlxA family with amidase domain